MKTVILLALMTGSAFAQDTIRCSETKNSKRWFEVKMKDGEFVDWNQKNFANPKSSEAYTLIKFPAFSDNDETVFEWARQTRAKNGYQIADIGTSFDSVKIGILMTKYVKGAKLKGFYEYRDLGSGNGDSNRRLSCLVK